MNLTPKTRFQKKANLAKKHLDWCAQDDTHEILEAALAHFTTTMAVSTSPNQSLDYHQRLVGAKEFINVLLNLAEPHEQPKPRRGDNLAPHTTPHTKE